MGETGKSQLFEKIQTTLTEYDVRMQKDAMRTVVHKIAIGPNGALEYKARSEVPGRLLNQFSIDESGGRFRVATTVEYYPPNSKVLYGYVYILGSDLDSRETRTIGARRVYIYDAIYR